MHGRHITPGCIIRFKLNPYLAAVVVAVAVAAQEEQGHVALAAVVEVAAFDWLHL